MSSEKLYSEILEEFQSVDSRADKIRVLRKYDHPRFRDFFVMLFNPKIEFDVEIPNYRPAVEPAGLNYTYLDMEMSRMYRFIKNHPRRTNLNPERQKSLLLVVLESLHKDEAELLVKLINKKVDVKFLTSKLVEEAFPGINVK